jgi:hypothetical protein
VTALHPNSGLTPRSSKFGSTARASGLPCSRAFRVRRGSRPNLSGSRRNGLEAVRTTPGIQVPFG